MFWEERETPTNGMMPNVRQRGREKKHLDGDFSLVCCLCVENLFVGNAKYVAHKWHTSTSLFLLYFFEKCRTQQNKRGFIKLSLKWKALHFFVCGISRIFKLVLNIFQYLKFLDWICRKQTCHNCERKNGLSQTRLCSQFTCFFSSFDEIHVFLLTIHSGCSI